MPRVRTGARCAAHRTLNPPQFWDLSIPLPPLSEQQQLVAMLDGAEARLTEAQRLQADAAAEVALWS